jgi:serine/threonine-protein kinase RsbW
MFACQSDAEYRKRRVSESGHTIRLVFPSNFEMLDLVQVLSNHVGQVVSIDDDSMHGVGVDARESIINAIKHGNGGDATKRVIVEFKFHPIDIPTHLTVRVVDQGEGFDLSAVVDPLAPENLLKSRGRGIFLMRNFMDDLRLVQPPGGGAEIRMVKRLG